MGNRKTNVVNHLYWKSKTIQKVCTSTKDAESRAMFKIVKDACFAAKNLEVLLFGKYVQKVDVKILTDSKPTLETIASTKRPDNKFLIDEIRMMKQLLITGVVKSFSWLSTTEQLADCLTKNMTEPSAFADIFLRNMFKYSSKEVCKVIAIGNEIRMTERDHNYN